MAATFASPEVRTAWASRAAYLRWRPPDDPQVIAATARAHILAAEDRRRNAAAVAHADLEHRRRGLLEAVEAGVRDLVAAGVPTSDRARLAGLLLGSTS